MTVSVVLDCPDEFREEARYSLSVLLGLVGVPFHCAEAKAPAPSAIRIYYGREREPSLGELLVPLSAPSAWREGRPGFASVGGVPVLLPSGGVVALRERDGASCEKPGALIREAATGGFSIGFDLVAAAFYLLARLEECLDPRRDQWGCFPAPYSISQPYLKYPLVNIYASLLEEALVRLKHRAAEPFLSIWPWPDGRPMAAALTHDVDRSYRGVWPRVQQVFTRTAREGWRGLRGAVGMCWDEARRHSYYSSASSFSEWVKAEDAFGFRSAFYFVAKRTNHRFDPEYQMSEPSLRRGLREVAAAGWEVGVHGSYGSYLDRSQLAREREALAELSQSAILGVRQHYMRFAVPETWHAQWEAGFKYDSTMGYNEALGYRNGIAAPFFPFDAARREVLPIMEVPLTLMDGVLFVTNALTPKAAVGSSIEVLDLAQKFRGLATILWHPDSRDRGFYRGWWQTYLALLDWLRRVGAFVATPCEIVQWWQARAVTSLRELPRTSESWEWSVETPVAMKGLCLRLEPVGQKGEVVVEGAAARVEKRGDLWWIVFPSLAGASAKITFRCEA